MKWECKCCGNCCELFAPIIFGKECEWFNKKTRKCDNYENRPQVCRTGLARLLKKYSNEYKSVEIEEYLIARCKLLKHLKKWKEETPESEVLHKAIMKACVMIRLP